MKRKLGIVPFIKSSYPLIICEPQDYEIHAVMAPHGIGIEGNDVSVLRNREQTGFCGTSNLKDGYDSCDVVLITDVTFMQNENDGSKLAYHSMTLSEYTRKALEEAVEQGKEILCFASMDRKDQKRYSQLCESKGIKFHYYERASMSTGRPTKFRQINIPVVFIGETSRDCDGYELFLKLIRSLNSDKKKVLALSEDKYNTLYGQCSVTFWGLNNPMESVLSINNYVAELADRTKPDVILIKLPEPMTKFDNDITFDFGLTAFLLSQALPADYMIYCSFYSFLNPEMMKNMSENFIAKFGYPISAIHISNQITDFAEDNKDIMQASFIDNKSNMEEIRKETGIPFFNLNNKEEYCEFYKALFGELFQLPYGVIAI